MQYSVQKAKRYIKNWQDKYSDMPESYTIAQNVYYHGIDDDNILVLIQAEIIDENMDFAVQLLGTVRAGLPCPDWCSSRTILTV